MNEYVVGSTSHVDLIFLQDSTSTTGGGKTGLAYNTAGLTCYYKRSNGTASVVVNLASISTLGTFVSGGFKEIDATNMPGCYEFDPPDAAFASGALEVTFFFTGVSGLVPRPIKYRIYGGVNPDDAVHGGMSALPNTACTTNASLLTSGSGTDQLTVSGGVASADAKKINSVPTTSVTAVAANVGTTQPVNFSGTGTTAYVKSDDEQINGQATSAAGTVTFPSSIASPTNITAGTITTVTNLTNAPTSGDFTATMKTSLVTAATAATPTVTISVGTGTGQLSITSGVVSANAVQVGSQTASAAGAVTFPGTIASPTNITAGTMTTVTNLTNAPTAGDFTAAMKSSLNAATPASVTGAVGSVTGNVGGNVTGSVGSVLGAVGSISGVTFPSGFSTLTVGNIQNGLAAQSTLVAGIAAILADIPTVAEIATGIFTDDTSSDFNTPGTPGYILVGQLGGAFTPTTSVYTEAALVNAPGGGGSGATYYIVSVPGGLFGSPNAPFGSFSYYAANNYAWSVNPTTTFVVASWTQFQFTVKINATDLDAAAILRVIISNPPESTDGLYWWNGQPVGGAVSKTDASITVNAINPLSLTLAVDAKAMQIAQGTYSAEWSWFSAAGKIVLGTGQVVIQQAVLDAIVKV